MKFRNLNRYLLIKVVISLSSLIFILIIFYLLIISLEEPTFGPRDSTLRLISIFLLIPVIILFSTLLIFTIKEYKTYFSKRTYLFEGKSYLTIDDVFENENRLAIITEILNKPGIHQNEILRKVNIQKGQLQWHLDVLLKYHIIKKKKYGQYVLYFPITTSSKDLDEYKHSFYKSKTTLEIFNIIEENAGITSSEISKKLRLSRNTIKYHVDKLIEENLIDLKRNGRKIELYPINGEVKDF